MKRSQGSDGGLKQNLDQVDSDLAAMEKFVAQGRTRLEVLLKESAGTAELDKVRAFIQKPWCVIPKSSREYWLIVPSFSNVHAGWLHSSSDTYRIFIVDRYSQWFGTIPEELKDELQIGEPLQATVEGGILKAHQSTANKVLEHVGQTIKKGEQWKVKNGHEFALLAELIEMGAMPFTATPVEADDLRQAPQLEGPLQSLRGYQTEAWHEFLNHGAIGVYWPPSTGKTVLGAYVCARVREEKLIVVPSRTLIEQWSERITTWAGPAVRKEVDIITYQSYHKVANKQYAVALFDESHRLPANTFSRFATIHAKYRLGLSASPFREDGRTSYVIALTGWPLGADWEMFIREGLIREPDIRVRILKNENAKLAVAAEEARTTKARCLIFCDGLDLGNKMAKRLNCPFIFGQTKERLAILAENRICVVSRTADEGLSLPDLEKVVELDFHAGSRRQELQRVGRLLHSQKATRGQHHVLMTAQEYSKHAKRFLAIEEKGFKVKIYDES